MLISSLSATLLNPFISCGAFAVDSLGLSSYILMYSATRDIFSLFPLMFYVMADVLLFGFFFVVVVFFTKHYIMSTCNIIKWS